MGPATDSKDREQWGVPVMTLTTGLKIGGAAKDSGAASSLSATPQAVTFDFSGVTGFANAKAVGIQVRASDVIDAVLGGAGTAPISEADKWSDMIFLSRHEVTDSVKLSSASATVLYYKIHIF